MSGVAAGFSELDRRHEPDIELAYFGLMEDFIGCGLGRFLLRWTVDQAWTRNPRRLWVHTCDLDHPRSLAVYQHAGFVPYPADHRDHRRPSPKREFSRRDRFA